MTLDQLKQKATASELALIHLAYEAGRADKAREIGPPWKLRREYLEKLQLKVTDWAESYREQFHPGISRQMFDHLGTVMNTWVEEAPQDAAP